MSDEQSSLTYRYNGTIYPAYLKTGNGCRFIAPHAAHFCRGIGIDVGAGKWPLPGAIAIDVATGGDAMALPDGAYDYVFSSHCLEHLQNPVAALEHWRSRIKPGGVLFLYLPHPDMEYWLPQNNRKHLHIWQPREVERMIRDLGFVGTLRSERDFAWGFAVVGFVPISDKATPDPTERFHALVKDSAKYFQNDAQMLSIFNRFGADAFRRSSMFDGLEEFIQSRKFRGKKCVEIGTFNGITALILARYFEQVVSIDVFPHTAKHVILEHVGVKNVRFIDVPDNAAKAQFLNEVEFDAAYVDGDHGDAETDFALVRRAGRVIFHEYWEQQKPVWDLVNRLKADGTVDVEGKLALWTAK